MANTTNPDCAVSSRISVAEGRARQAVDGRDSLPDRNQQPTSGATYTSKKGVKVMIASASVAHQIVAVLRASARLIRPSPPRDNTPNRLLKIAAPREIKTDRPLSRTMPRLESIRPSPPSIAAEPT